MKYSLTDKLQIAGFALFNPATITIAIIAAVVVVAPIVAVVALVLDAEKK